MINSENMNEELELRIRDASMENLKMDGVKWEKCTIDINVDITSNKELSNIINSLRYLREGSPK